MGTLKEHVREAARVAEEECVHQDFDAMSWLDFALEENPEFFDIYFDIIWDKLSEDERQERTIAIREVL